MLKNFIQKFNLIYEQYPSIGALFTFLLAFFLISIFYLAIPGFLFTDDHFFHFKYAYLLRTQGFKINDNFDWIYLATEYTRKAKLFQIAIIPFTFINNSETGLKIFDTFLASSTLSLIYYSLRKLKADYALFWTFLLITSSFCVGRLLSGRNFVFSIGLVLFLTYLAIAEKHYKFFLASALCVLWRPSIFFMPFVIAAIAETSRYLSYRKINLKIIIASLTSVIITLFYFSFDTFISLFSFYKKIIPGMNLGEGAEIYPMDILQISNNSGLFLLIMLLSFAFVFYVYISNRNSERSINSQNTLALYTAFLFLFVFLAGTVIVNGRFFDFYYVGVIFLASACISYAKQDVLNLDVRLKNFLFGGIFIFMFITGANTFIDIKKNTYLGDIAPYKSVADWVGNGSSPKDKVYLYDWGIFPVIFFFNDKNIYSTGMEPMTLNAYDEKLYWKWYYIFNYNLYCDSEEDCLKQLKNRSSLRVSATKEQLDLINKEDGRKIIESIKNDFQAKYIIADNKTALFFELNKDLIAASFSAKSDINGKVIWGYKLK